MSTYCWGIVGYGVKISNIMKYVNTQKVNDIVRKKFPDELFEEDVFDDDTFFGNPYMCFADFLCDLDEDNMFLFETDGQDESYFLYEAAYPWEPEHKKPETEKECQDKIVAVLRKVCDTSDENLRNQIEYISDYGCS